MHSYPRKRYTEEPVKIHDNPFQFLQLTTPKIYFFRQLFDLYIYMYMVYQTDLSIKKTRYFLIGHTELRNYRDYDRKRKYFFWM